MPNAALDALLAPVREHLDRALLAFDFDGSLAPIVARPEDARLAPGALEVLTALAERAAAVVIVTGRPAMTAVELGGFDAVARLAVLGHYGLQRWQDGTLTTPEPDPGIAVVWAALQAICPSGGLVEDKDHSVVIHTRGTAEPDRDLEALREPVAALAAENGLEVVGGRLVWEVRPPGVDKAVALRSVAAQVDPAVILVAGDDLGDLPLFAAAAGLGIPYVRIAVVSEGAAPEVAQAADATVDGPSELVAMLRSLLSA
jgi:trehalose 6-phosphate phosphatase